MIRNARSVDIPIIVAMLHEMHKASKYFGRVEISDKAAENMLESAIASQGSHGPQGSHVIIAFEKGEPVGFMIGVLDRVYSIGTKLTANDLYLYTRPGASQKHVLGLLDSYVEWASSKRACIEIMLSWSDALPGAAKIAMLYGRKGFVQSGEMFEMRLDTEQRRIAA